MNRERKIMEYSALATSALNLITMQVELLNDALALQPSEFREASITNVNNSLVSILADFAPKGKQIMLQVEFPRYKIVRDKLEPSTNLPEFSSKEKNRLLVEKLIEEAKEALDAYENANYEDFLEELGDLESVLEAVKYQHVVSEAELSEVKYLKTELKGGFRNLVVREVK